MIFLKVLPEPDGDEGQYRDDVKRDGERAQDDRSEL